METKNNKKHISLFVVSPGIENNKQFFWDLLTSSPSLELGSLGSLWVHWIHRLLWIGSSINPGSNPGWAEKHILKLFQQQLTISYYITFRRINVRSYSRVKDMAWHSKTYGITIWGDKEPHLYHLPTILVLGHQGSFIPFGEGDAMAAVAAVATARGQGKFLRESCVGRPGRRGWNSAREVPRASLGLAVGGSWA